MDNLIFYAKIDSGGFTNRIISFVQAIIEGIKQKCKIVIYDNYINDTTNNLFVPISQIIDVVDLNKYLIAKYNIIVIDKSCTRFNISTAFYGTDTTQIDITEEIRQCILPPPTNYLFISKHTDFNRIKGDPAFGKRKKIHIIYEFAMNIENIIYTIEETYDEILRSHIVIDMLNPKHTLMFDSLRDSFTYPSYFQLIEDILTKIKYMPVFQINAAKTMLQIKANQTVNVIHLRVEQDAIEHWSVINKMNPTEFKETIETKYIQLIQKYISNNDYVIVLSDSNCAYSYPTKQTNSVMRFLKDHNYNVIIPEKYYGNRHLNAIVDMLISRECNGVFIGCVNLTKLNGSTFSYYCQKMMDTSVKRVMFDIDFILDPEVVY